ncbi:MAG: glucose-1-phosphate adenylyltransferase [Chitinispirillaceae bacterium]|nr:glucose-1-phosphate adenylyltransferase [Chitinispirillaceae bacterium]
MPSNVTSIILAGGQGSRLHPLTQSRSKPAVPIGGKFRLIDIPISNCLHHGIRSMWVLTQFASESLHRHIFQSYRLDSFSGGFVTVLAASQTTDSKGWYQGTADAVRKNLANFDQAGDTVLLLSGDHLYRMDFSEFLQFHESNNADISLSVIPVPRSRVTEFGVLKMDHDYRVRDFVEKPKVDGIIDDYAIPAALRKYKDGEEGTHVASMGIYVFSKKVLFDVLSEYDFDDFGKQIIPAAINNYRVFAYPFNGYWEDIGTIRSFFNAHMAMTVRNPPFDFYDPKNPIFTNRRYLPAAKISGSNIDSSIICEGCMIENAKITDSVIGVRSIIRDGSHLSRVILMGADTYEFESKEGLRMGIGQNCHIRNAIIDKDAHIGDGAVLINRGNLENTERDGIVIRDGIIIVPKGVNVPARYVL